jgi:hypothetical protein
LQRECPSLTHLEEGDIHLKVRFDDGVDRNSIADTLFKVLPEAWPAAVTENLPLVHISTRSRVGVMVAGGGNKEKTWDDLVKEGALLGVH